MPTRKHDPLRARLYSRLGHHMVEGWLAPLDARIVTTLGDVQTAAGIGGGVGEIGVHHGRLAGLLYLLLHEGERGFAVDVFGDMEANVDASGCGDEARFRETLELLGISAGDVTVLQRDSQTLASDELREVCGPVRLFSIDGGHTPEITRADLRLADAVLHERGVVVLDDVFNKDWPGVAEGFFAFLAEPTRNLAVFALSVNKVFLCRPAQREFYSEHLGSALANELHKHSTVAGSPALVLGATEVRQRRRRRSSSGTLPIAGRHVARALRWYRMRAARWIFARRTGLGPAPRSEQQGRRPGAP